MAMSLENLKKKTTDPSSTRNALSDGVKIVKIGPVDPEILDQIVDIYTSSWWVVSPFYDFLQFLIHGC